MLILTSALTLALLSPTGQAARQKPGTIEVRVTDRTGAVLDGVTVRAEGAVPREGTTDAEGGLTLRNVPGGSYRMRFERDGYVTLEKDVTVKAGAPLSVNAALTPAPPPPPAPKPEPPPPAPPPPASKLAPGSPLVLDVVGFADKQLEANKKRTTMETPIGCSGASASRLLQVFTPVDAHSHPDADEVLYVLAGEATLMLAGRQHQLAVGAMAIVPRGAEHTITRRSRGPVVLISTLSGPACS